MISISEKNINSHYMLPPLTIVSQEGKDKKKKKRALRSLIDISLEKEEKRKAV